MLPRWNNWRLATGSLSVHNSFPKTASEDLRRQGPKCLLFSSVSLEMYAPTRSTTERRTVIANVCFQTGINTILKRCLKVVQEMNFYDTVKLLDLTHITVLSGIRITYAVGYWKVVYNTLIFTIYKLIK